MHDDMIGGAVLTNWLAIIGVVSLIYWAWRIVAALRQHGGNGQRAAPAIDVLATDAPGPPPAQPGQESPPMEDIAVIAAAVYAMLGTHRIVHLEADQSGRAWTVEGRWAQQISHTPR